MRSARPVALLLVVALCGCYSAPFERPQMVPIGDVTPAEVRDGFAARLPERYETEDTLIFRFLWRKIAVLGYTRVDRAERRFEALCLNHIGVPLFSIGGDAEGNYLRRAMPEFAEREELTERVAADIRRIAFDLVPPPGAEAQVLKDRVIFRQSRPDGAMEYVFGGPGLLLLKKRFIAGGRRRWEVAFYEYAGPDGYVHPGGIVLHNREGRYRLIVRTRDVTFDVEPFSDEAPAQ